jgi:hypothetical protein
MQSQLIVHLERGRVREVIRSGILRLSLRKQARLEVAGKGDSQPAGAKDLAKDKAKERSSHNILQAGHAQLGSQASTSPEVLREVGVGVQGVVAGAGNVLLEAVRQVICPKLGEPSQHLGPAGVNLGLGRVHKGLQAMSS